MREDFTPPPTGVRASVEEEGRFGPDWALGFEFPVERGKILEFARALKCSHPALCGQAAVAPPTFLASAAQIWGYSWERPGDSILGDWHVTPENVLHLEEEYRIHRAALRAGDVLQGKTVLGTPVRKVGRRAGPMTLLELRTDYRDNSGRLAATARQLVVRRDEIGALTDSLAQPASAVKPRSSEAVDAQRRVAARRFGPITIEDCVVYQAASGDLSPQHYDPDVLKAAGFTRFFSPGMLIAGLMSTPVADVYGPDAVRHVLFRFEEIVDVGETVECTLDLAEEQSEPDLLLLELACTRSDGVVAVRGHATVATR